MPEFRQDLKRYEKKKRSASDVWKVVKFIQSGGELPDNLDAKQLREPYQEFWGCHIKADLILQGPRAAGRSYELRCQAPQKDEREDRRDLETVRDDTDEYGSPSFHVERL